MATVNKDFKIKSGLVVEGLQGTINGEVILTENAGDQYILDLIGGETLVKSVSNQFDVSAGGELSLDRTVVDAYYDEAGSADAAEAAANSYTDGREAAITTAYEAYADTAEQDAKDYADDLINDASNLSTEVWSAYKTATEISVAQTAAEAYTDTRETAITTAYEAYADQAEVDAKAYTDTEIAALVDSAPALLDTLNELAAAIGDNPNYATDLATSVGTKVSKAGDTMTGALTLSGAPTSNLHAATKAYVDSAESNAISTASSDATSKANAAQAAAEATASSDATSKANAAQAAAEATASADATSKANAAEAAAIAHADALTTDDVAEGTTQYFTDARAKSSAASLLTGASLTNITITGTGAGLTITAENGVADSTTTDLAEGTNLYFTDARARTAVDGTNRSFTSVELNSVAKQVAATLSAPTAGIQVAHAFAKADYRSAEYLVKVAYGTHTEISKVLLTLDSSDNIAITEYGIVGTNGSASSISAGISGANVQLQVTTANNDSTVTVMGTLLK